MILADTFSNRAQNIALVHPISSLTANSDMHDIDVQRSCLLVCLPFCIFFSFKTSKLTFKEFVYGVAACKGDNALKVILNDAKLFF